MEANIGRPPSPLNLKSSSRFTFYLKDVCTATLNNAVPNESARCVWRVWSPRAITYSATTDWAPVATESSVVEHLLLLASKTKVVNEKYSCVHVEKSETEIKHDMRMLHLNAVPSMLYDRVSTASEQARSSRPVLTPTLKPKTMTVAVETKLCDVMSQGGLITIGDQSHDITNIDGLHSFVTTAISRPLDDEPANISETVDSMLWLSEYKDDNGVVCCLVNFTNMNPWHLRRLYKFLYDIETVEAESRVNNPTELVYTSDGYEESEEDDDAVDAVAVFPDGARGNGFASSKKRKTGYIKPIKIKFTIRPADWVQCEGCNKWRRVPFELHDEFDKKSGPFAGSWYCEDMYKSGMPTSLELQKCARSRALVR